MLLNLATVSAIYHDFRSRPRILQLATDRPVCFSLNPNRNRCALNSFFAHSLQMKALNRMSGPDRPMVAVATSRHERGDSTRIVQSDPQFEHASFSQYAHFHVGESPPSTQKSQTVTVTVLVVSIYVSTPPLRLVRPFAQIHQT